jgi:hypothetical protein
VTRDGHYTYSVTRSYCHYLLLRRNYEALSYSNWRGYEFPSFETNGKQLVKQPSFERYGKPMGTSQATRTRTFLFSATICLSLMLYYIKKYLKIVSSISVRPDFEKACLTNSQSLSFLPISYFHLFLFTELWPLLHTFSSDFLLKIFGESGVPNEDGFSAQEKRIHFIPL